MSNKKREHDEGSDAEDDWIGPLPSEAAPQKKQRGKFNLAHWFTIDKYSLRFIKFYVI